MRPGSVRSEKKTGRIGAAMAPVGRTATIDNPLQTMQNRFQSEDKTNSEQLISACTCSRWEGIT